MYKMFKKSYINPLMFHSKSDPFTTTITIVNFKKDTKSPLFCKCLFGTPIRDDSRSFLSKQSFFCV